MIFSFKLFKPHGFFFFRCFCCFGKSAVHIFNRQIKNSISSPNHRRQGERAQWLQRAPPSFGNMRSLQGSGGGLGRGKGTLPCINFPGLRQPLLLQRRENTVVGVPVEAAGALDIHFGKKRHQCGKLDKHGKRQRRLRDRPAKKQSKPLCRAQERPNQSGNLHRPWARENWVTVPRKSECRPDR